MLTLGRSRRDGGLGVSVLVISPIPRAFHLYLAVRVGVEQMLLHSFQVLGLGCEVVKGGSSGFLVLVGPGTRVLKDARPWMKGAGSLFIWLLLTATVNLPVSTELQLSAKMGFQLPLLSFSCCCTMSSASSN